MVQWIRFFNVRLGMGHLSLRWVLCLLTTGYKRNRLTTAKECLALFSRSLDTPKTKQHSKKISKKQMLFHQDNAYMYTYLVDIAKLNELGYQLLPQSPLSRILPEMTSSFIQIWRIGSAERDLAPIIKSSLKRSYIKNPNND